MNKSSLALLACGVVLAGMPEFPAEEKQPWQPKEYGRKMPKGNTFRSRETSPRFRRTGSGRMKLKRR